MIKLRRKKFFDRTPEITSLIDIVFILLIFFLLTAVYRPTGLDLDLPSAQSAHEQKDNPTVISVTAQNEVYLNDRLVSLEILEEKLKALPAKSPMTLRGDKETDYGIFIQVLDKVRKHGEHPLNLAAEIDMGKLKVQ